MRHPELVQLLEYLDQPESAQQAATLDHLSDCVHCRARAARLAQLQTQVQRHVVQLHGAGAADSNARLRAELHASVHSAALQRDLSQAPVPRQGSNTSSLLQRIAALFTLPLPLWMPAAATAAVFAAVLGLPMLASDEDAATALVAYQDAPVMRFQSSGEAQPGIGFFSGANRIEHPFKGVEATRLDARTLMLRWPAVDHALAYRVSISHIGGSARQPVADVTTQEPQARIVNFEFIARSRYEWVIEGKTHEGMQFSATGGFVVR